MFVEYELINDWFRIYFLEEKDEIFDLVLTEDGYLDYYGLGYGSELFKKGAINYLNEKEIKFKILA